MAIETTIRRIGIVALFAAVAFGGYRAIQTPAVAAGADRLTERMDQYVALRRADDQVGIYQLTDPEQRKIKRLEKYLEFYGTGILKVIDMTYDDIRVDADANLARVRLKTTLQLIPERLPKPYNNLDEEHPEHLRRSGEEELDWVWREDDWYLRMQREFVTGKSADGRSLQGITPNGIGQ
jgi:hypothetical protein